MSIITLWKVNVFSRGKESYESALVLAQLWEKGYVIPLFTSTRSNPVVDWIVFFSSK